MTPPDFAATPFARWRARMGDRLGLGKPLGIAKAGEMLGYAAPNQATKLDRATRLDQTVALACAAIEAGLSPIT